jgi:hypothetical protein
MEAFNGNWQRRGLVHVPVIADTPAGRPPQPTFGEWSEKDLREAHRCWNLGVRDLSTVEGERVYQARRKRAQRAGAMSPIDRVWAEKNAVKSSWEQWTRANRDASVANTT